MPANLDLQKPEFFKEKGFCVDVLQRLPECLFLDPSRGRRVSFGGDRGASGGD